MSSYKGTLLQTRKRARKFGFRARLGTDVIKTKRLKKRTRMAVVVKSLKQRLAK
jgi:ribosomal protein L34